MEFGDYIILLASCVIELYIGYDFFSAFFEKKIAKKERQTLLILGFTAIVFSVNMIGSANVNLLTVPIIQYLFLMISFNVKAIQGLMYYLIVFTAQMGAEFIFVVIVNVTANDSALNLSEIPGLVFIVKMIGYLILLLIKKLAGRNKGKVVNRVFWMYLCLPVTSLGMMFATFFAVEQFVEDKRITLFLSLSFALVLISNIIVFQAFNRYAEQLHDSVEKEWIITREELNKNYYKKILDMYEQKQHLVHDMKHYLTAIRALMKQGEQKEVAETLLSLYQDIEETEKYTYSNIPFLDSILSDKHIYAQEKNVTFHVNVEPGISLGGIKKTEYIIMLGNLLDNAIQGAGKLLSDGKVQVNIFMDHHRSFLVTKIKNNCQADRLSRNENGDFLSTNENPGIHGIGLKSVKRIAEQNNGIFSIDVDEAWFVATLVLPTN